MPDSPPRFEIADNQGTTVQSSGTVGTTPISFPAVAGPPISEFLIQCVENQDVDHRLQVSLDGGSNWITLYPTGHLAWTPKGQSVVQLTLKGSEPNVGYEILANLEVD